MRRALLALLVLAWLITVPQSPAMAVAAEPYTFKNVNIGGGGFVPGIVFNQKEKDLIYARTDIGGVYRWDKATGKWIPLMDGIAGWDTWNRMGGVSVATDPVDPNRVYVAAGMYTNDWDARNGAILRSTNRGATWAVTELPFKGSGNMPGRGMGERLAIDPNKNNIIYYGTANANGLWRSTDYGVTWAKVTSFPNVGNFAQDPNDTQYNYNTMTQGIPWITFDPRTGTAGNATQTIYAGVADKENNLYKSTDAGATWTRVAGQPTGYVPHKGVLDHVNGYLYLATGDTGGPYINEDGEVWRLTTATGVWTEITPTPDADRYYGFSGFTIDRQDPSTIMVASQVSWWPDNIIFRSTDSGATWTRIWDWNGYPSRTFRYTQDISSHPWLTMGKQSQQPEVDPKLGWMTEAMEIDPFDSNRLLYGTGATIYGTTDLLKWDNNQQITIKPFIAGLEETAVLDLISPPTGANLLSAVGDIGGFRHTSLDAVPSMMYRTPLHVTTRSMDYAELSPSTIVRVGDTSETGVTHLGVSTDGGANWWQANGEPGGITGGGYVAISANAGSIVWAPGGAAPHYSTTLGSSWTAVSGLPTGAQVRADRVTAGRFYGYHGGKFYVSTNNGATFTQTAATGLPTGGAGWGVEGATTTTVRFKTVPGQAGHVWIVAGSPSTGQYNNGITYGVWKSTDGGTSFTRLSNVTAAENIGFGKAATGASYMAVYLVGMIDGVHGLFRSNDGGTSWVRINDDQHQYANMGEALTGDPRVYGRVYLGTNGRGIIYGDPSGTQTDTQAPTKPGTPVASAVTSSGATLTWTASTDNVAVTGYDVYRGSTLAGSTTATSFTATGLSPATAYTFTVRAKDAAGNTSVASDGVTFTTTSGTDTQAPTKPGTPVASAVTSSGATLTWTASTDNVAVTGYDVYRGSTLAGSTTTTSFTATGLSPSTAYTYTVRAKDAAGNVSTASDPVTFTTSQGGTGKACTATYTKNNEWPGGFGANVTVANTGSVAMTGWTVTWTYANGQTVTSHWSADLVQTGANVTARNLSYNGAVAVNGSTSFGFNGAWSNANTNPTPTCTPA
ncbi:cellulose binding domain-containing protein [Nonomuraea soli]|uniref:Chitodextrinase n=1 Tax=Nonomuraea soli TaxID=1032476 RepID=A0A7W0CJU8_9ACTN|nr:cellulose binding domain-containing protein [Nonomuraea soli]MBA2892486.1 chitodextrinase [Nonomuraea soli]